MSVVSLATPFDSIEYQAEGLLLTRCSCAGTSHYYLPRKHVDNIGMGRELWIKMLLLGLVLTIYGVVKYSDDMSVTEQLALYFGAAILVWCAFKMIPTTLSIVTNNGVFESSKCCNKDSFVALLAWMSGPASAGGGRVAVSVGGGNAFMMQPMAHGQVVPVALHPPPIQTQQSAGQRAGASWQQQQPRSNNGDAYVVRDPSASYASLNSPHGVPAQPLWNAPSSSPTAAAGASPRVRRDAASGQQQQTTQLGEAIEMPLLTGEQ